MRVSSEMDRMWDKKNRKLNRWNLLKEFTHCSVATISGIRFNKQHLFRLLIDQINHSFAGFVVSFAVRAGHACVVFWLIYRHSLDCCYVPHQILLLIVALWLEYFVQHNFCRHHRWCIFRCHNSLRKNDHKSFEWCACVYGEKFEIFVSCSSDHIHQKFSNSWEMLLNLITLLCWIFRNWH